ncbi:MAG: hypothetical protein AAF933_12370, partial [Pseudomonadota bacterium]
AQRQGEADEEEKREGAPRESVTTDHCASAAALPTARRLDTGGILRIRFAQHGGLPACAVFFRHAFVLILPYRCALMSGRCDAGDIIDERECLRKASSVPRPADDPVEPTDQTVAILAPAVTGAACPRVPPGLAPRRCITGAHLVRL